MSSATFHAWIDAFFSNPYLAWGVGPVLYGSVAALGAGWDYRRLTETKGRSLESITEEFRARWEAYGNRRHRHHMVAASNTS